MGIINYEAKELMLEKIGEYGISDDALEKKVKQRKDFTSVFSREFILKLTPKDYFPGLGNKNDCIGYQLEWGTKSLGSIKGGSIAKYGSKEQFEDIKELLLNLVNYEDDVREFYDAHMEVNHKLDDLITWSRKIRGMKSGRTVLGKLLSIYYPNTFIPIFNEQNYLLKKILKEYAIDSIGLESYFKNNAMLLLIKEELLGEPGFSVHVDHSEFTNDVYYEYLYHCFPRNEKVIEDEELEKDEDEKYQALEREHYQKLIHRNIKKLFPKLRYYDDVQNEVDGHYSTEDAGIMDILCLDQNDDFVIIELKRKCTDTTVGQLCRYMGWVRDNLAKDGQQVNGIIIGESRDIKIEYALKVVPNIQIKQMKLDISIKDF